MAKNLTRAQINAVLDRVGVLINARRSELAAERTRVNDQLRDFTFVTHEEFVEALQKKRIVPMSNDNEILQGGWRYYEFCLNDKALLKKQAAISARIDKLDAYKEEQLADLRFNLTLTGNDEAKDIVSEMKEYLNDYF